VTIHEDLGYYNSENGCPHDCEEYMIECNVCGSEFCSRCYPDTNICGECAKSEFDLEEGEEEEKGDPDFEDVPSLKKLMAEDEAMEEIIRDDVTAPPQAPKKEKTRAKS